jgi:hypothetical protein
VKVIERVSVQACLAIATRIQRDRQLAGDEAGSAAARQVAKHIKEELLEGGVGQS